MNRPFSSLNGWQRLWIVCGVISFLIIIVLAAPSIPHALTIDEYLGEEVDNGNVVPSETLRYVRLSNKWVRVEGIQNNDKTNEYRFKLNGEWSQPTSSLEYAMIPRDLSNEEAWLLKARQAKFVGAMFMYWLFSWLSFYLLGLAVAWTIAGFRQEKAK
jgi:hypothetical protein